MARSTVILLVAMFLAAHGSAEIKVYTADADNSTRFPSDRRIYRGDCDPNAATPNAGDDQALADDQCKCTPGVDCVLNAVPAPKLCNAGSRQFLDCNINADCPGGTCTTASSGEDCVGSAGRPNGGVCDPSIAFPNPGSCTPGFPVHGSPEPPCNLTTGGTVVIDDTGNGTPTLQSMTLIAEWDDVVGATNVTGIPGATVELHTENTITVAPNQTGAGSTNSTIDWGVITGWSQTGRLFCQTHCKGFCGAVSGCKPFVGFDGLGPPAHLKSSVFNTGPWVFTGDQFTAPSFEIVSLGLGSPVTAAIQIGGRLVAIPALPLAALGGLGAGLVYLGVRGLGGKRA